MHPDNKYILYLLNNDHLGIQTIYDRYARKVVRLIMKNSGSDDDAYDILQEALVDIYHMARDRNFVLTTNFESFLLLVCKRKWLNQLKKNKVSGVTNAEEHVFDSIDDSDRVYEEHLMQVEKENVVMELLETLGDRCKEIIKTCMTTKNQEQIADKMGISYAYLRKKKSECMSKLGEIVKSHRIFN